MYISFEKLAALISKIMNKPELAMRLKEDDDLFATLGIDSMQMISLFLQVEDQFNIELNFEAMDFGHLTARRLLHYIHSAAQIDGELND